MFLWLLPWSRQGEVCEHCLPWRLISPLLGPGMLRFCAWASCFFWFFVMSGHSCVLCIWYKHSAHEPNLLVDVFVIDGYKDGSEVYEGVINDLDPTYNIFTLVPNSFPIWRKPVLDNIITFTACPQFCQPFRRLWDSKPTWLFVSSWCSSSKFSNDVTRNAKLWRLANFNEAP